MEGRDGRLLEGEGLRAEAQDFKDGAAGKESDAGSNESDYLLN